MSRLVLSLVVLLSCGDGGGGRRDPAGLEALAAASAHGSSGVDATTTSAPKLEPVLKADPSPAHARMPGRPARGRGAQAARDNAECVRCHEVEARAWSGSQHHRAFEDEAFHEAFRFEPTAFCATCHAPEASGLPIPREAAALGVACVTCHVDDDGAVLATNETRSSRTSPHPVRRSASFGTAAACAGCHEFRFPGELHGDADGAFMQTTVREHARSPSADRACASCHMPTREGRRSHGFAEVRDPAWLRESLAVEAALVAPDSVHVTLTQMRPGHAFPTGDLFRRLEVGAEVRGPRGELLLRRTRHLTRHFHATAATRGRQLVDDDRVLFEPRVVELDTRPPPGGPPATSVRWWVSLQRVAQTFDGLDPSAAVVESEVPLYEGTLPWSPQTP